MDNINNYQTNNIPPEDLNYINSPFTDGNYRYSYVPQGYTVQPPKPKKQKKPFRFVPLLIVLTIITSTAAGIGGGYAGYKIAASSTPVAQTQNTVQNLSTIKKTDGMTLAEIAQAVSPSVVEITTEAMSGNSFISQLIESGAGSGIIYSEDGYIITNNHVIENASNIKVRTSDGTEYSATLIGTDSDSDIAVLKIDASGLAAATLGDSAGLVVGQEVVAVGNPLGELGGTVTNGIISALDRNVTVDGHTMSLLQTNAAINPGNSGGGLFDADGNLIGVVNAKSGGTNIEGLGFAIPINSVKAVITDLIGQGYVSGKISTGMTLVEISNELTAMRYGVNNLGVYVYSVDNNSSAEIAGLESGDLITSVNGSEIDTTQDVKEAFTDAGVGKTVTLTVIRSGKEKNISLLLTEYIPDTSKTA